MYILTKVKFSVGNTEWEESEDNVTMTLQCLEMPQIVIVTCIFAIIIIHVYYYY